MKPSTLSFVEALQDFLQQDMDPDTSATTWVQDNLMSSCKKADDDELPKTGMSKEIEKGFSSIFIEPLNFQGKLYGTHTQTVITGWADGRVDYHEKALYPAKQGDESDSPRISFHRLSIPINAKWQSS